MTVTQQTRPAAATGRVRLDELTVAELDLIIAHLRVAWRATAIVDRPLSPLWCDLDELLDDAHAAWQIAFDREHPGIRVGAS
jgi:hypothetical protein